MMDILVNSSNNGCVELKSRSNSGTKAGMGIQFVTRSDLQFIKHYNTYITDTDEGCYKEICERLHTKCLKVNLVKKYVKNRIKANDLSNKNALLDGNEKQGVPNKFGDKVIAELTSIRKGISVGREAYFDSVCDYLVTELWKVSKENLHRRMSGEDLVRETCLLTTLIEDEFQDTKAFELSCVPVDNKEQFKHIKFYSIDEAVDDVLLGLPVPTAVNKKDLETYRLSEKSCRFLKRSQSTTQSEIVNLYKPSILYHNLCLDQICDESGDESLLTESFDIPLVTNIDSAMKGNDQRNDKEIEDKEEMQISDSKDKTNTTISEGMSADKTELTTSNPSDHEMIIANSAETHPANNTNVNSVQLSILLLTLVQQWNRKDHKSNMKTMKKLLGMDTELKLSDIWHPLIVFAFRTKDRKLIQILLSKSPAQTDNTAKNWYESLYHVAVRSEELKVVKVLEECIGMTEESLSECNKITGITPFLLAVKLNLRDIVEYFLLKIENMKSSNEISYQKKCDFIGQNASHIAAKTGDILMFKLIKPSIREGDKFNHTPLSIAVEAGHTDIVKFITNKFDIKAISCKLYSEETYGLSLLHMACKCNSVKTVQLLLADGLDPNITNFGTESGVSPIFGTLNTEILKLLLPISNIHAKHEEFTAVQALCYWPVNLIDTSKKVCDALVTFAKYGADLNSNSHGITLLSEILSRPCGSLRHNQFSLHQKDLMKCLLENGADPNLLCTDPAIVMINKSLQKCSFDVFEMLVKHNISYKFFMLEPLDNESVLQWAYTNCYFEYLELMVSAGCAVDVWHLDTSTNQLESLVIEGELDDITKYEANHGRSVYERFSKLDQCPRSLMTMCKIAIKQSLGHKNPEKDIDSLILPNMMKDFLSYKYIPLIFRKVEQ